MSVYNIKEDMLCLLSAESISSMSSLSNISEYCLRNNSAVKRYLLQKGSAGRYVSGVCSDFELLCEFLRLAREDKNSGVVKACLHAMEELMGRDIYRISCDELWKISSEIIERMYGKSILPGLDRLGMAITCAEEELPKKVGNTELISVACPAGIGKFDIDVRNVEGTSFGRLLEKGGKVALFMGGFEFAEPNEYMALRAQDKLLGGSVLSDNERRIFNSQLCRNIFKHCFDAQKDIMIFLPEAPDVHSMGESARLLDYIDRAGFEGKVRVSVFAGDAVGLCFASSLLSKKYKNIAADTGICGNGCGIPDADCAEYWGVGHFPKKRASLAVSPAFLCKDQSLFS